MRRTNVWLVVAAIVALAALQAANAAVPQMINYQGRLADDGGNPLDTTVSMVFTIYDQATDGTPIWWEEQTDVVVADGLFTVLLGGVIPVTAAVFDSDSRYLGIQVGEDPEILPRTRLVTAAYAFNSEKLGGYTAEAIIAMIPDPVTLNGEFIRYALSTSGSVVEVIESDPSLIREITSMSISTGDNSGVSVTIDGQEILRIVLESPNRNYTWYRNGGAGIIIEPGQTLSAYGSLGDTQILITGFEYLSR